MLLPSIDSFTLPSSQTTTCAGPSYEAAAEHREPRLDHRFDNTKSGGCHMISFKDGNSIELKLWAKAV